MLIVYLVGLFQVQSGVSRSDLSAGPSRHRNFLRIFLSILPEHDVGHELPEGRNSKRKVCPGPRLSVGESILLLDLQDLQLGDSPPVLYEARSVWFDQ